MAFRHSEYGRIELRVSEAGDILAGAARARCPRSAVGGSATHGKIA